MIRFLYLSLILLFSIALHGQQSINQYKYIIIPESYDLRKATSAYQLNAMSKFLFTKYGFKAYIRGEQLPAELLSNGCMGLRARVKENSSLFVTRLTVELINCNEQVLFTSIAGESSEKDYKKAYQQALRNAFTSVEALQYVYTPGTSTVSPPPKTKIVETVVKSVPVPEQLVVKAKENTGEAITNTANEYHWNTTKIELQKEPYGYLMTKGSATKSITLGKLYALSKTNQYLVTTETVCGSAYFDTNGNIVIEHIDSKTNTVIKDILELQ